MSESPFVGAFVLDPAALDVPQEFTALGATFLVRHLSPGRLRKIRKGLGLPAWAPDGETLTDGERQGLEDASLDWTLAGWRDVVGPDGSPLECTLANKRMLIEECGVIDAALGRWSQQVWAMAQLNARQAEGNSSSSSSCGADATPTGTTATTDATGSVGASYTGSEPV